MKKKDLILISIIIILIAIIIGILIYLNAKKDLSNKESTIIAEVLVVGKDYLLVTTEDEIDYVINTKNLQYKVGDKLKFELKNIDKDQTPIEATAKSITIIEEIEKNINKVEDDQDKKITSPEGNVSQDNSSKTEDITNTNNSITNVDTQNNNSTLEENFTESDVINYFDNLDTELSNYNNTNVDKNIKSKFVKCIDFIFYDGTIGGKTFNELTTSTKLQIIKIAISIDSKIDEIFPGYKENINTTYQNIKNKLIEKYLDITTTICNNDEELCTNAKEGFKDLKNNFGLTWNIIKDLAGTGKTKLKKWYEIWRYN